jgi:hypothetical protein
MSELKELRKQTVGDQSNVSELELHENNPEQKASWQAIQDLKAKISMEKAQALKAIDEKYKDQIQELVNEYGMVMVLSR